jgi:hypothetical protein
VAHAPPYERRTGFGEFEQLVPPGGYRVSFRVGPESLHERELYVGDGARVTVTADQDLSAEWEYYEPSEVQLWTKGPARRVIVGVPTLSLPMRMDATLFAAISAEGVTLGEQALEHLSTSHGSYGFASFEAPDGPFDVVLYSRDLGAVRVPSAVLPDRPTAVIVRFRRGRLDVVQSMLRAREGMTWGDAVREVVLARQLARSNEFLSLPDAVLDAVIAATDLDPLIACLIMYGSSRGVVVAERLGLPLERAERLPDVRVALAYAEPSRVAELLEPLLDEGTVPLLNRSIAALAEYARSTGREGHAIVQRRSRLRSDQAFATEWWGSGQLGRDAFTNAEGLLSPGVAGAGA